MITFDLNKSAPNLVLKEAKGHWLVEDISDRLINSICFDLPFICLTHFDVMAFFSDCSRCRVWLKARIKVSRVIPTFVVDYAASRALPRATGWLKPFFAVNSSKT